MKCKKYGNNRLFVMFIVAALALVALAGVVVVSNDNNDVSAVGSWNGSSDIAVGTTEYVYNGDSVTVSGSPTVNGTLIVESGATLTIPVSTSVTLSGKLIIQGTGTLVLAGVLYVSDGATTTITNTATIDYSGGGTIFGVLVKTTNRTYTGSLQTPSVTLVKTETLESQTPSYVTGTNAGTYTGSYMVVFISGVSYTVYFDWTINKAALTVNVDETETYDGVDFSYTLLDADAVGLVASDSLTAGALTTTDSDVGVYDTETTDWLVSTAITTTNGISNYSVTYAVSLEITVAPLVITVDETETYDGVDFSYTLLDADAVGLVASDSLTAGALTTTDSDVGVYDTETTDWTVSTAITTTNGISNYSVTYAVSLEIETAMINVTGVIESDYDGTTDFTNVYLTGVGSETVTLYITTFDKDVATYEFATVLANGKYVVSITDTNYVISESSTATFSITAIDDLFVSVDVITSYNNYTVTYTADVETSVPCDLFMYVWSANGIPISGATEQSYILTYEYADTTISVTVSSIDGTDTVSDNAIANYYVLDINYADESEVIKFYISDRSIGSSLGTDSLSGYVFIGWYYNTYGDEVVSATDSFDAGQVIYVESRFAVPEVTRTSYLVSIELTDADEDYLTFTVTLSSDQDTPMENMSNIFYYVGVYSSTGVKVTAFGATIYNIDDYGNASWTIHVENLAGLGSVKVQIMNSSASLILIDPQSTCTYTAEEYTIEASAGTGGSISPSGDVSVDVGQSQTFTITASSGYEISDVLVDGASVGIQSTYTFGYVTSDHTIVVIYASSE